MTESLRDPPTVPNNVPTSGSVMGFGPITVFDKSALQLLSLNESVWLDNFFYSNITPLFYVETLSDLEREFKSGRQPEEVVGDIARKTPINSMPNAHHSTVASNELLGLLAEPVAMNGAIAVSGGTPSTMGEKPGVVFKQTPEEEALRRWRKGQFLELERDTARAWRRALAISNWAPWAQQFRALMGPETPEASLPAVKSAVDGVLGARQNQAALLNLAADAAGVPSALRASVAERWGAAGEPLLPEFAPYAAHLLRVDAFFALSVELGLLSRERPSNKVDIAYLYYLPFCMVFVSNDGLHRSTAPLFLRDDQTFVWGEKLGSPKVRVGTEIS